MEKNRVLLGELKSKRFETISLKTSIVQMSDSFTSYL